MTLPSTKRPREVEEEMAARTAAEKLYHEKLLEEARKVNTFRKTMHDWYTTMSKKQKRVLTPKTLKRKAINVCYTNNIVYDNLPLDWLTELQANCNLKLYQRKKKVVNDSTDDKGALERSGVLNSSRISNGSTTKEVQPRKRSRRASSPVGSKTSSIVPEAAPRSNHSEQAVKRFKRFLDLSMDPPPPAWFKAYSKGTVLPRLLTIYSTEDTNILFYDYNPTLKDDLGRDIKLTPQPRIGLDYLINLMTVKP